MNIKKIVLSASAAALIGGFAFAPNAQAGEGECDSVADVGNVAYVYGESPETSGEGCLVVEGGGDVPVNPLDDGHIGIYDNGDGPALYGSCDGRDENGDFKPFDPTTGDSGSAQEACSPA